MPIFYEWRGRFDNAEVNSLHAEGFSHPPARADWWGRVSRHSLGWVCARDDGVLVGFVNVAWDGAAHAFILDTVVAERLRRRGVGARLIAAAVDQARAAGCAWLHVDFAHDLRDFYFDACGFSSTDAGLIALSQAPERLPPRPEPGTGPLDRRDDQRAQIRHNSDR